MIMKANLLGINKLGHVIDLLKNVAEQIIKERRKIRIIMEFKNWERKKAWFLDQIKHAKLSLYLVDTMNLFTESKKFTCQGKLF